jgi:putative transposase
VRPARKRQLVDELRSLWKVSTRHACSTLKVDRALYVHKSRRGEQADLKARIKEIAETRMRYGYRRIHVLLRREGWLVNPKRIYRLDKEIGLQLRNKTPRRRVKAKLREDRSAAANLRARSRTTISPGLTATLRPSKLPCKSPAIYSRSKY